MEAFYDEIHDTPYFTLGQRLRGTRGDRPPQKVRWRGRKCFYPPQYLENVLQIYNVKTNKNEKEGETHVTRDRHIPLSRLT